MKHDEISEIYKSRHADHGAMPLEYSTDPRLRYMRRYIPQNKDAAILDAGCGDGKLAIFWGHQGYTEVDGIDLFDSLETWGKYRYKKGSVDAIPFEDNTFDFLYCMGVVVYLDNPQSVFNEFYRVLKPGAKMVVSAHTKYSLFTAERVFLRSLGGEAHLQDVRFQSAATYAGHMRAAGLEVLDSDGYQLFWMPKLAQRAWNKVKRMTFDKRKPDGSMPQEAAHHPSWYKHLRATAGYHMLIAAGKPEVG